MNGNNNNLLYLNRDNRWLGFKWDGLELGEDGALRLVSLPLLEGDPPEGLMNLPLPTGPAGIAVGPDGAIYYSDPSGHRLLRIDSCDGTLTSVPCLGGEGGQPTQFREPRGVLFHHIRQAIFVADSGNHRIQIFDPSSFQLLGIWGQLGTEPGRFNTPWSLAGDPEGNVYVVDYGNRRVQKFDLMGNVIPAFWDTVQQQNIALSQPSDVAVSTQENSIKVFILDASFQKVLIFDSNGHLLHSFSLGLLQKPMGLALAEDALYVGDNDQRRLHKFIQDGKYIGAALGYEGPVAALSLDAHGNLLVHTGSGLIPVRLSLKGRYVKRGIAWGGPFRNTSSRSEQWHRLKARIAPLLPGAHFRLFFYTFAPLVDTKAAKPLIITPPPDPETTNFLFVPPWKPIDLDVSEQIFPGNPLDYVWVGVESIGEGLTSPILSQMRLDFDHETYIQYLPTIYKEDSPSRSFLIRFLSLFESLFNDVENTIASLSVLFDPGAVHAQFLPWLAGWLAIDLDENWPEEKKRQAMADAFEMYTLRGTAEGIRKALRFFAGVDARIEEPILHAAWWSLPADETSPSVETRNSILGFTTMLAPAEAQGAVVGTTAVLDQSHLITQEEFGVPLFEDIAHQFLVQVYQGQVPREKKLDEVRSLLDREKPVHTTYHLCIIQPRMRVGFQATVGIDTVVAGPLTPTRLGKTPVPSMGLILGGEPAGRIGERGQVGRTTRLGEGIVGD